MEISIIIPTCDRADTLRMCLAALAAQVLGDGTEEVLVTDDGVTHQSRDMVAVEFPSFRWIEGPKKGPAANRNRGASKATGELLLFIDDDCVPTKQYLSAYRRASSDSAGHLVALEGATIREAEPSSLLWEAPHNPTGGTLSSCNFGIRKQVFLEVGKFDERYPVAAFEDTEFAERFRLSGGRVHFVPNAEVFHPLRPVRNPSKLAARWEGKAIFALDQGATPFRILWGLPWHVLRVIQSRFWGQPWSVGNIRAAFLFAVEWLLVCWRTPRWVGNHARHPRHEFWIRYVAQHGPAAKFGF